MPREPRMKFEKVEKLKSSDIPAIIEKIQEIIAFINEQYEKEKGIVGVRPDCLSVHGPNGYCENCPQAKEKECCEKCFVKDGWMKGQCFEGKCECHTKKPISERNEKEKCCFDCGVGSDGCNERLCFCHTVSERNDDDAKKCPYRIPDCPIDYPDVSERNSLID